MKNRGNSIAGIQRIS